jgi:hypothetical protein
MSGPEFDREGYPTEATLERIQTWQGDYFALAEFVKDAWTYPDYVKREEVQDKHDGPCVEYRFATGGWSGNEELLSALRDNFVFHSLYWESSHRGGLVIYRVYKLKEA